MNHPLDRPVWQALSTTHAHLALITPRARRYPADFAPFAATPDDTAESQAAILVLLSPGTGAAFFTIQAPPTPAGLEQVMAATGHQMLATAIAPPAEGLEILSLGPEDVADMQVLVDLTRPGPFAPRTHELGQYLGIRNNNGALVAMAGERFRLTGYTEISAVCTHPDHRGQSHASRLVAALAQIILARNEIPFLHVFSNNAPAIALYQSMGFTTRRTMHVTVLRNAASR